MDHALKNLIPIGAPLVYKIIIGDNLSKYSPRFLGSLSHGGFIKVKPRDPLLVTLLLLLDLCLVPFRCFCP